MWTIVWLLTVAFGGARRPGADRPTRAGELAGQSVGARGHAAREIGEIPPIEQTPLMKQWDDWGKAVLRDGDILFRRGDAQLLFGHFPFSRFIAAAQPFSHTGIVAIEDGEPVVYDTTKPGSAASRSRSGSSTTSARSASSGSSPRIAVPRPGVRLLPRVVREAGAVRLRPGIDDQALLRGDDREGLPRRRADAVGAGPARRHGEHHAVPDLRARFPKLSNLSLDQPVYFPGNERHGIWSCPRLVTVYESRPTPDEQKGWFGWDETDP